MQQEHDFSDAEQGRFFNFGATLQLPRNSINLLDNPTLTNALTKTGLLTISITLGLTFAHVLLTAPLEALVAIVFINLLVLLKLCRE